MIREIVRAMSGDGVDADARAIGQAGASHAQSIAELERDVAAISPRWTGDAAVGIYSHLGRYARDSYQVDREARQTVTQLGVLGQAARRTNTRFRDLREPELSWRDANIVSVVDILGRDSVVAQAAPEIRAIYTVPLQSDGSTMPLGTKVVPASIDLGDSAGGIGGGTSSGERPPEGSIPAPGSSAPGGGDESGGGTAGTPAAEAGTDRGSRSTAAAQDETLAGSTDSGGSGPGGGPTGGAGAPSSTGTGIDGGGFDDAGLPTSTDDPSTDPEPYESGAGIAPLLSSAGSTSTGGAAGRGSLGGGGMRGGVGGTTASPLGLRSDSTAVRGTAPAAVAGASTTGARPSTSVGGVPAGAGAGQRGQGDGRHRTPGYLIDRANGEEIIGGLPLVGPGVIGEWRSDGAAEVVRRPEPPVRGEPRRK
ncbi:hypothetical protein [Tsukamurella paurometabola]|nr:hypothetical protein [Tsukamurella paurometabola]